MKAYWKTCKNYMQKKKLGVSFNGKVSLIWQDSVSMIHTWMWQESWGLLQCWRLGIYHIRDDRSFNVKSTLVLGGREGVWAETKLLSFFYPTSNFWQLYLILNVYWKKLFHLFVAWMDSRTVVLKTLFTEPVLQTMNEMKNPKLTITLTV